MSLWSHEAMWRIAEVIAAHYTSSALSRPHTFVPTEFFKRGYAAWRDGSEPPPSINGWAGWLAACMEEE